MDSEKKEEQLYSASNTITPNVIIPPRKVGFITPFIEESICSTNCYFNHKDGDTIPDEYYDDIGYNGLSDNWDPNEPLEPLIPLKYTATLSSTVSSLSFLSYNDNKDNNEKDDDNDNDNEKLQKCDEKFNDDNGDNDDGDNDILSEDKLEIFFNTFIDCDLEGEITICQWVSSLTELCPNITEKDLYQLFNYIDQEKSGYLDSVDFIKFCHEKKFDNVSHNNMIQIQSALISAITNHPFMTNCLKME